MEIKTLSLWLSRLRKEKQKKHGPGSYLEFENLSLVAMRNRTIDRLVRVGVCVGFYCDKPIVIVYELYIDPTYKLHNIVVAYNYPFHPVAREEYWPEVPGQRLRPNPAALRSPGRPRSTRINNEMDWKE
ncbi:serine/threonine-protein phosphatase 7 long form-like protein [Senna tora]|uniref:Serine/threonine-protein phosphatase 7 long form-like protein n=1 Tax=Senna tora TaxID=362788 RepID=A0A834VXL4_9FABA|nr:serine/threonine-protein phosphatase 7 long form-like protein [Senna tora]